MNSKKSVSKKMNSKKIVSVKPKTFLQKNKNYATIGSALGLTALLGSGLIYALKKPKYYYPEKIGKFRASLYISECSRDLNLDCFKRVNDKSKIKLTPEELEKYFKYMVELRKLPGDELQKMYDELNPE